MELAVFRVSLYSTFNAAPSARTPANPAINDVVPTAPLTRAYIRTHLDIGNRVLMRLNAKLAFLETAKATRFDEKMGKTERDLALLVAERIDTVQAARAPAANPPARPATRAAHANESAPLSLHVRFQRFSMGNPYVMNVTSQQTWSDIDPFSTDYNLWSLEYFDEGYIVSTTFSTSDLPPWKLPPYGDRASCGPSFFIGQ